MWREWFSDWAIFEVLNDLAARDWFTAATNLSEVLWSNLIMRKMKWGVAAAAAAVSVVLSPSALGQCPDYTTFSQVS